MDAISAALSQNTKMVQSAISTSVLRKSMGVDMQAMAGVLEMMPEQPAQQLAVKAGSMDISV